MSTERAPRVLFVPVSSPAGAGEYYRCLTLAQACLQQHPTWSLHICADRNASVARPQSIHCHEIDGSPTRDVDGVKRLIRQLAPDLVVFDSTLRQALIRASHDIGAKVVFISSRPNRRRLGFSARKLPSLSGHWMITTPQTQQLTVWERLKLRFFPHRQICFFTTLMPQPDAQRRRNLLQGSGLPEEDYILVAPGGGGGMIDGQPVAPVFQQAAKEIRRQTELPVLFIAGPLSEVALEEDGDPVQWRSVAPEALSDLIAGARLVVSGGGSIVQQTLALQRPCLAVEAAGQDQRERLTTLSEQGVIRTCAPQPRTMAATAGELASSPERLQLLDNAMRAGFTNDMPRAVDAMEEMLRSCSSAADARGDGP